MAFTRHGSGPTALLLHGAMSSADEWLDLDLPEVDVVAWDAPGGGESGDPGEEWSLVDFADCAWGLLDALGVGEVHVAGLSFGGGLALALYARQPHRVRTLGLLSAYAGWAGSLAPEEVASRLAGCLAQAADPQLPSVEEAAGFLGTTAPPAMAQRLVALEARTRPVAYRVQGRAFAAADLREVLPTVTVPTLVVHGTDDLRARRPVADALHQGIRGSELLVLEGVGHCVNLEAPALVSQALRSLWGVTGP